MHNFEVGIITRKHCIHPMSKLILWLQCYAINLPELVNWGQHLFLKAAEQLAVFQLVKQCAEQCFHAKHTKIENIPKSQKKALKQKNFLTNILLY